MLPVYDIPQPTRHEEAEALQKSLAARVVLQALPLNVVKYVASADVAYHENTAYAAVILWDVSAKAVLEKVDWTGPVADGYMPGLFALREAACLEPAFMKLRQRPDVLLLDGHGIAHPRRFGLACHIGLRFQIPSIGCAKTPLYGAWEILGPDQGARTAILDEGQILGHAVRTQSGVKPVFVSPGHMCDADSATALVLACAGAYRIPAPQREAHLHAIGLREVKTKPSP
jgi:deoxyribonuclease V